ncbi:MAG: SUMF1/EgtB/PvdO family nonheme iron enzyme [Rhodothermales bacterium]|nr:SUMF1/EgtB/PvdO family nonheme iron enzyme [Rhodothermales bacterium]
MRKAVFAIALLALVLGAESSHGQSFFVNAGGVFNSASASVPTTQSSIQVGSRLGLTDIFRVTGLLSMQSATSAEFGLQVWPMRGGGRVEPYAFVGYGRYLNGGIRQSVVPVGAGLALKVKPQWSINLEVARRTSLLQSDAGSASTLSAFSPTLGVTYDLKEIIPGRRRRARSLRNDVARPVPDRRRIRDRDEQEAVETADEEKAPAERAPVAAGMLTLKDGMFIMGLADEDPLSMQAAGFKRVTVAGFLLDPTEITNAAYRKFLDELGSDRKAAMLPDSTVWHEAGFRFSWRAYFEGTAFDRHPVVAITHSQAQAYCASHGKRLPSEAEWEYAARAGRAGGIYPWQGYEPRDRSGDYLANYNNGRSGYAADGYAFTAPVSAYEPNAWGFYNMSGNVAEWVEDAYSPTYSVLSDFNPIHEDEAEVMRVVRGGSWASDAFYIGVGVRDAQPKDEASPFVGARCARDVADLLVNPARAVNRAAIDESEPELQEN